MLKEFYKKSELWFSIVWIIIYVVIMGNLKKNFGVESLYSVLALFIIGIILTVFIFKNNLSKKYGFVHIKNPKKFLYFIPLILICTVPLWFGVSMNYDLRYQIFAVLTMALVGYVEEIIFRGLLFKAIEKDSVKQAIIISAVTFGIGHIVNLFTGAAIFSTVLQIGYAVAIGFAFVMVFYKSGSLIPCIITHSIIDITSRFANQSSSLSESVMWEIIPAVFLIIVAGGYAIYLHKAVKK